MERFFRKPWIIVAVIGAVTVFFAAQLPRARLDNNNFRFVPKNDPERLAAIRIDEDFGSQMMILVGLERRHGTVLEPEFLERLRAYVNELEALREVDSVQSVISSDYVTGTADSIVVEPLVPEDFAGTRVQIAELRDRLTSWDLYRRSLVSDDFRATQVMVYLDLLSEDAGGEAAQRVFAEVRRLAREAGFTGTEIYLTGIPVFSSVINEAMAADLVFLIPLVVIVVLGVLFLSFRRAGGIVLPLLTVLISTVWAVGAMPLAGIKLSILSTVLPVILVAVGSAYGIHVVSHYYDEMAGAGSPDGEAHRRIVIHTLRTVRAPVLLAALTTFAGFVSFCFTPVVPIFEFGVFSSLGVLAAFGVSVTLIPALLLLRGPPRRLPRFRVTEIETGSEDPLSAAIADSLCAASRKRRSILAAAALAAVFSCFGVSRLVIDNVLVEYFRQDTQIALSDRFIREYFGGSKTVSVVVRSPTPGEVLRPDVLSALDGLSAYLQQSVPEVGKAAGFTDLVKRMNQILNADESPEGIRPATRAVPVGLSSSGAGEPAFGFGAADSGAAPAFGFGTESSADMADEPAFGFAEAAGFPAASDSGEQGAGTDDRAPPPSEPLDGKGVAELVKRALSEGPSRGLSADQLADRIYRAVNYRGAAYYEIPTDPARYGKTTPEELKDLVSNYLVLMSGDLSAFADDPLEPTAIRTGIQLRTLGQIDTDRAVEAIRGYAAERFPKDVTVEIGGAALVERSLNRLVVQSQLTSVALSLVMVFLILSVYYRSAAAGLIGLAPLSVSVLVNFAVMWAAGIKLNIGTAMMASITVGIGIDYIVHYMAAYHREYLAGGGGNSFLRRTFLTSGKAILFNAASVGAGFAVLMLSRFKILGELGLLISLAMATSALVSLTVLPVLISLADPAFIKRPIPVRRPKTQAEVSP